jgi:hypothetical protein
LPKSECIFLYSQGGTMTKVLSVMFVTAAAAAIAMADSTPVAGVPEISPAAVPAALVLLGGGILVVRSYLKK